MLETHIRYRIPGHLQENCLKLLDLVCQPELLPHAEKGIITGRGWIIRAARMSSMDDLAIRREIWIGREDIRVIQIMHFRNAKGWTCLVGERHRGFPPDSFDRFFEGLAMEFLASLRAMIAEQKKNMAANCARLAEFVTRISRHKPLPNNGIGGGVLRAGGVFRPGASAPGHFS